MKYISTLALLLCLGAALVAPDATSAITLTAAFAAAPQFRDYLAPCADSDGLCTYTYCIVPLQIQNPSFLQYIMFVSTPSFCDGRGVGSCVKASGRSYAPAIDFDGEPVQALVIDKAEEKPSQNCS